MRTARIGTPLGTVEATQTDYGLSSLTFVEAEKGPPGMMPDLEEWLFKYFSGEDPGPLWMDIDLTGSTPFQITIYRELIKVKFGRCIGYKELGEMAGYRGSPRAVGGAVGSNPILLVIPCHRVLARSGSRYELGGFSAGIDLKERLLRLEGIRL